MHISDVGMTRNLLRWSSTYECSDKHFLYNFSSPVFNILAVFMLEISINNYSRQLYLVLSLSIISCFIDTARTGSRPGRRPASQAAKTIQPPYRHTGKKLHVVCTSLVVINYSYLIAFTVTVKPRSYRSKIPVAVLVSTQLALSVVLNGVTSQVLSHVRIFINSSLALCVHAGRIMYHYCGLPARAVPARTQCRWRGVQTGAGGFNSSNSNETAKPDRKPMCWGQVSYTSLHLPLRSAIFNE